MPRVCHANPPRNRLLIGKRGRAVFEQVSGRRLRAATMTRCCYRDTEATGTARFATIVPGPTLASGRRGEWTNQSRSSKVGNAIS
jgi:hypothetical protein